jgi:hypothetical protein
MSATTFTPFDRACDLIDRIEARVLDRSFHFRIERDVKRPEDGRPFIQCIYEAPCTITGEAKLWHGRKWYLSDHMTEDEVVKTCYAAFKAAVEHEVMEGFTFEGQRVFNPHTPFRTLIEASKVQAFRP